jgi:hypothetical protein
LPLINSAYKVEGTIPAQTFADYEGEIAFVLPAEDIRVEHLNRNFTPERNHDNSVNQLVLYNFSN